jgi:hypothetical protein
VKAPGIAVSANKAAFIAEGAPIPVNDLVATLKTRVKCGSEDRIISAASCRAE